MNPLASGAAVKLGTGLQFDGSGNVEIVGTAVAAALTAGDGISIAGTTVAVDLASSNAGLDFTSNKLRIKERIEPREMGLAAGTGGAIDACLTLTNHPSTPAINSRARLLFSGKNASAGTENTLTITSGMTDITAGTEMAQSLVEVLSRGAAKRVMSFDTAVAGGAGYAIATIGSAPVGIDATMTLCIDDNNKTNAIGEGLRLQHSVTGGTGAVGTGTGIQFEVENASGNLVEMAKTSASWASPNAGSETSVMNFQVLEGGSAINTLKLEGAQAVYGGGVAVNRVVVNNTSAFLVGKHHYLIACLPTTAGGAMDIRLPLANSVPAGTTIVVKDEEGGASVNNIIIKTAGSDTLDGFGTADLIHNTNWGAVQMYSDGANSWHIY